MKNLKLYWRFENIGTQPYLGFTITLEANTEYTKPPTFQVSASAEVAKLYRQAKNCEDKMNYKGQDTVTYHLENPYERSGLIQSSDCSRCC